MIKKLVLLVENETVIALSLKMKLEEYGYNVIICTSGEQAIEKVGENVDIVLMDISLGNGMDGIETAEKILEKVDLPIIFTSAYIDQKVMDRIEKFSYGYIQKNFNIVLLNTAIKIAIKLFNEKQKTNDVFDHSINGICVYRMIYNDKYEAIDCEHLKMNKSFEELTDVTQDAIGKTMMEIHRDNPEIKRIIKDYAKVVRNQEPLKKEFYYGHDNKWFNMSVFPTRNHSQFAVVLENISERKEKELRDCL